MLHGRKVASLLRLGLALSKHLDNRGLRLPTFPSNLNQAADTWAINQNHRVRLMFVRHVYCVLREVRGSDEDTRARLMVDNHPDETLDVSRPDQRIRFMALALNNDPLALLVPALNINPTVTRATNGFDITITERPQ